MLRRGQFGNKGTVPFSLMDKIDRLKDILSKMQGAVVAYSGGVDSTFLLKVAHDVMGDKVLAVVARSATYQKREYEDAVRLAGEIGVPLKVIDTDELDNPRFSDNSPERCYYCKEELFNKLKKMGDGNVIYGATMSDIGDFRPGSDAAKELGVRAPLQEAGFTKEEIRELSKEIGLPTWDKPAMACLASRFPYGEKITERQLNNVEKAEEYIRGLGFKNVRVRVYNKLARIEVDKEDIKDVLKARVNIVNKLKELGFIYITLDMEGYRSGSMNEVL